MTSPATACPRSSRAAWTAARASSPWRGRSSRPASGTAAARCRDRRRSSTGTATASRTSSSRVPPGCLRLARRWCGAVRVADQGRCVRLARDRRRRSRGLPDIAVATLGQYVVVYRHNGTELFANRIYDTSLSTPALADLDGDGRLEVIVGADMDEGNGANLPPYNLAPGGFLWAWHSDGTQVAGFPRHLSDQVIWSSPSVADLNGDGSLDIVVGTGENWPNRGHTLFAVDRNGNNLPGWPVAMPGPTMGSPAIADLDGDGRLDVAQQSGDGSIDYIAATATAGSSSATGRTSARRRTRARPVRSTVDRRSATSTATAPRTWSRSPRRTCASSAASPGTRSRPRRSSPTPGRRDRTRRCSTTTTTPTSSPPSGWTPTGTASAGSATSSRPGSGARATATARSTGRCSTTT